MTVNIIKIKLNWLKNTDTFAKNFYYYMSMRDWLKNNNIIYIFEWIDTGKYYPDHLILEEEFATVFKLTFGI
jgi:hypothetical protein